MTTNIDTKGPNQQSKQDEPVDGLDGSVQLAPGQLLRSCYALFYNKKFGLTLILATGLWTLLGVLFPQIPSGVRDDPEGMLSWLESVRPTYGGWTDIMNTIGLFNVFSSVIFLVLMGLLALSIIACTTHRLPVLYQTAFRPHTKMTATFFTRARLNLAFTTVLAPAAAAEVISTDAKARRARVIVDERGPGENLYTDRWHLAPFGTAIAHAAFVVIMAGFVVSSLTGFRDEQFTLTVGSPAEVGHGTGLVAEARSFADTYYDDGTPKDYVTDLVLYRDGQQVAQQDVRVNAPLNYDGVSFHQAFFGIAAVMRVTDASGQVLVNNGIPLTRSTPDRSVSYGVVKIPGRDQELFVIGAASGQQMTGIGPGQMKIEVYRPGGQVPVGTAVLDQGGSVTVEGLTYSFEREQQFTGLLVKRDPGTAVVWLGCALLIIGTCSTMFLRHHRIWFRVQAGPDGDSLVQMASPDRADTIFARQFAEIGDHLNQKMTGNQDGESDA